MRKFQIGLMIVVENNLNYLIENQLIVNILKRSFILGFNFFFVSLSKRQE